jgi:hypothetical protein
VTSGGPSFLISSFFCASSEMSGSCSSTTCAAGS